MEVSFSFRCERKAELFFLDLFTPEWLRFGYIAIKKIKICGNENKIVIEQCICM